MPFSVDAEELQSANVQCSFLSICSLTDVTEAFDDEDVDVAGCIVNRSTNSGQLLAAGIDFESVSR